MDLRLILTVFIGIFEFLFHSHAARECNLSSLGKKFSYLDEGRVDSSWQRLWLGTLFRSLFSWLAPEKQRQATVLENAEMWFGSL